MSRYSNEKQSLNASFAVVHISDENVFIFNVSKDSHPLNIYSIEVTLAISKFDKSKSFNFLQLSNIDDISLTCSVLKFFIIKLFKDEQYINIFAIFVTFLVLKFDKFKEIKDLQL